MTNLSIEKINKLIQNRNIKLLKIRHHTKASESYIDVDFKFPEEKFIWHGAIPFQYRRAGLFLEKTSDIAKLINKAYEAFKEKNRKSWIKLEEKLWNTEYSSKEVTKEFFIKMLNIRWNCVDCDLPKNPNWARRTQDIKEMGYLTATKREVCRKCNGNKTHMILLPFGRGEETGYEIWSQKLKNKIIKTLGGINIYDNKKAPSIRSLIPDHKFPEIRWDKDTRKHNPDDMTKKQIKKKFQLLDNQRNLQKREVCRKCFQTNKRGSSFGMNYYYKGNANWPTKIAKIGKDAEKGCIGCPWYDFNAWRKSLNKRLKK